MIIYDCEIRQCILGRGETKMPDMKYCEGWHDFQGMGISTICAYDYATDRHRVFLRDNFHEFQQLVDDTDIVVGFNSLRFDNQLCKAHDLNVPDEKSYDILVEMWVAAGLPREFKFGSHTGYSLGKTCEVNFNIPKSGDGALAPVLWQQGKYGQVIDYCLHDIRMTKLVLDHIIGQNVFLSPKKKGVILKVASPV